MIKQPESNPNKVAIDLISSLYFDLIKTDGSLPSNYAFDLAITMSIRFCEQLMRTYDLIDNTNPKADYFAADMFVFYKQVKKSIPLIKINQIKVQE
jgi:hypothetical protein